MKRFTASLFLTFCVFSTIATVDVTESFALAPMFELDTKTLGRKVQAAPQTVAPLAKSQADTVAIPEPQPPKPARKSVKKQQGSENQGPSTPPHSTKASEKVISKKHSKPLKNPQTRSAQKKTHTVKKMQVPAAASPGVLTQAKRLPPGRECDIQWARDIWGHILEPANHENEPLIVDGRNFSLSLDPKRYPVMTAADGGRIVIDEGKTLSPQVKTILRGKDPGIRIVSGDTSNRERFFSSLLTAAKFYSVEDNFSVDFGSDPKLTVTTDFKIEKTPNSLLENDVFLVNMAGKSMGMPPQLVSFLDLEGFHVIDSSPVFSEVANGSKVLYCMEGSHRDTLVDELFMALSTPYDKNRNLLLDDGILSGVRLSVMADRYSENNNQKVVVSFFEEDPVQYTLLRLLDLKGYRVVMLKPEDDFRIISEKLLSALGLPAHYGMQALWAQDETPFNVRLSGFMVEGSGQDGVRKFLTNVPVAPLIGELARYKGFNVIMK